MSNTPKVNSTDLSNNLSTKREISPLDLAKIATAYSSPPWWYDMRGFFILTFAYQSTLWSQVLFFERNIRDKHMEVAMGTGTLFKMILWYRSLRRKDMPAITGMDYSESMLAGARKRFAAYKNVEIRQQDVTQLTASDGAFQSVNIANSLHCFVDVDAALREVHRVLAPGGSLAVNVLLYPRGRGLLSKIAEAINNWGIKKGILVTPYEKEVAKNKIIAAGFEIREESVSGNCYSVLAIRH